jgi:hypothetical protein
MRGRARLVLFAVTMGGVGAALVAPSAGLALSQLPTGPGTLRAPIGAPRTTRAIPGEGSSVRATSSGTLPQVALVAFVAPAPAPAVVATTTVPSVPAVVPPVPAPLRAAAALTGFVAPAPRATPHPAPTPRAAPVAASAASPGGAWACIRQHESGGNYATNTGNGYYGAYQFSLSTWRSIGGTGLPSQAPPAVQDAMAQKLQQRSGWGQWSTHSMCGV